MTAGLLALGVLSFTESLAAAFSGTIMLSTHVLPVFHMCSRGLLMVRRDRGAALERTTEPCGKMTDSERIGSENEDHCQQCTAEYFACPLRQGELG